MKLDCLGSLDSNQRITLQEVLTRSVGQFGLPKH
jgi:hypothetical protein